MEFQGLFNDVDLLSNSPFVTFVNLNTFQNPSTILSLLKSKVSISEAVTVAPLNVEYSLPYPTSIVIT